MVRNLALDAGNSGFILFSLLWKLKPIFPQSDPMARAHARSAHFPFRRMLWACGKKILDTSGQKQEALNRSSILALEPEPGLTLGYTECLDSCRFLSNPSLWGWKPYGTWTQLCSFLGFACICPLWSWWEFGMHLVGWLKVGTVLMMCRRLFGTLWSCGENPHFHVFFFSTGWHARMTSFQIRSDLQSKKGRAEKMRIFI